jgi:uncharacterized protein
MASFKGRSNELTILEEHLKEMGPKLFILHGMRRVGKTELLKKLTKRRTFFYFCASSSSDTDLLRRFKQTIERLYLTPLSRRLDTISWETLIAFLIENISRRAGVLILDDFQVMQNANRQISSILARQWGEKAGKKEIMLILSGSDAVVMEEEILNGDSPLRAHVTGSLHLSPLLFSDTRAFFPQYSEAEQVLCFSALGGIPAYMSRFDPRKPLEQNIKKELLEKDSYLFREPLVHLWEEMREPGQYFSLLHAISRGFIRLPEITRESGMKDIYATNKYLFALRERRILRRLTPFTEEDPKKSRKGRYDFENPFFRFWFRYIYPNKSDLELGETDLLWREKIRPDLIAFCRTAFVDICLQRLERLCRYNKLPFKVQKMGRWWNRSDSIDLVAEGADGFLLICLCSWTDKRLGSDCLAGLGKKARWFPNATRIYYGLFSGEGFSKELNAKAKEHEEILLLDYF